MHLYINSVLTPNSALSPKFLFRGIIGFYQTVEEKSSLSTSNGQSKARSSLSGVRNIRMEGSEVPRGMSV